MICKRSLQVSNLTWAQIDTILQFFVYHPLGKEQLEELKNMKKVVEPILTAEEKASKTNKAEIKGTGFQMQMVTSEKGRVMIEA